jgi:predicted AlkP superfamily phosphohydrolase/phosphomutase
MRAYVLGLDGATFDLIAPWVSRGELPNMKRLMDEGSHGSLMSPLPAHSAPSWSSFITGKNPGKHGIFDFSEHVDGSYEVKFVNASRRQGMSIWATASRYDKKVAVVNVPMTFPPEKVNGIMISGMDAPGIDSNFTYPATLSDELKRIIGDYSLEAGLWSYINKGEINLAIEKQHETIDKRFEVIKYLMNNYPWDLFVSVFTATDRVQHAFWKYMDPRHPSYKLEEAKKYGDAILDVYRKMDHIVGYLLDHLSEDTVLFIMSDHGAGLCSNKTLYLNNWLCREGLLEYKDFRPQQGSGNSQRLKRLLYTKLLGGLPRDFWKALPRETRDQVRRRFPVVFNKMASQFFFSRINMDETKAYAEESKNFIWVNLKGREPRGTVRPGREYEEVRERIIHGLIGEKDPGSGEQVVENVFRREDIYHGDSFEKAPDLIVTFKDLGYVPRPSYTVAPDVVLKTIPRLELEKSESNTRANARHLPNGILLMRGKGIRPGRKIDGAKIMDLAPTILYTMGLPVPTDMDGKVLESAYQESVLLEKPISHDSVERSEPAVQDMVYSPEEEEAIRQRLGDLGYLE